ncbi:MAG: TonB-dependent receptor [Daejeonella sp.]
MKYIFTVLTVAVICFFNINQALAQNITVKGKVIDSANGETIPGVSVTLKGTSTGSVTDIKGNFSLSVPEDAVLIFTSIGYITHEEPVSQRLEINITLKASNNELEQVVVVGYGTQRKVDVTGSISSVKGADINKQASQNPLSSLQGKVAGVQITNNGSPGSSPRVRIRGTGSVYGRTEPLYVIDGIIVNDLSFLNQNDIETMDVLKDASSASIYGLRAANGVVLVTTKKGKSGTAKINYNAFAGAQIVTNKVQMASAKQYGLLINEKFGIPTVAEYPTTDWYDVVLRPVAMVQNHQLSISGGSEKNTYNVSLGYLNQDGAVRNNNYQKITGRLQNDIKLNKNIKVGYNALLYHYNSFDNPGSIFLDAYRTPPIMPVRKANGNYGDSFDYNLGDFPNPQVSLDWYNKKSKGQSMTSTAFADVKFLKDFTFHSSVALSYAINQNRDYLSLDSFTTVQKRNRSKLTKETGNTTGLLIENTLTYQKTLGKHRFTVLAGTSAQQIKGEKIIGSISDVPFYNEGSLNFDLGTDTTTILDNDTYIERYLSYFGRINYAFKDRYLLTATLRRDGASKFPISNPFDNFPSIGLGWIVSDEGFMKKQHIFDLLKLKASWGKLGNAGIPDNLTQSLVSVGGIFNTTPFGPGSNINKKASETLVWEVVKETDLGLEMAFLNNRLTVNTDYYIKNTENAIFAIPIIASIGVEGSSIQGNYATFRNSGFELAANWRAQAGAWNYNLGVNGSYNKNQVIAIATGNNEILGGSLPIGGIFTNITRIGDPIGSFYGYVVDGIFQTDAEAVGSAQPFAKAGSFKYHDLNKDGVIDKKDKQIIGNPNPRFTYGFTSGFEFKNFDLQLDIQGVAGVEVYNATKVIRSGNENYTLDFYQNRWHGPGTSNTYPSANLAGTDLETNSWYVESGDYVRLRNVQLGYTLAKNISNKLNIQKIRIYLNAQNPYTYFKYKGFTPEVGGDPLSSGIDLNVYPLSATYNAGVNVTF